MTLGLKVPICGSMFPAGTNRVWFECFEAKDVELHNTQDLVATGILRQSAIASHHRHDDLRNRSLSLVRIVAYSTCFGGTVLETRHWHSHEQTFRPPLYQCLQWTRPRSQSRRKRHNRVAGRVLGFRCMVDSRTLGRPPSIFKPVF